ncbi:MAG: hypothetical protein KMY50_11740 [Candidatus Desulforudis sp.]|nr:hypothetical protein [Desulforudis sp.]
MYEIEEVLVFLSATIKVLNRRQPDFEVGHLRDSRGMLQKGRAVNYILAGLEGQPEMYELIQKAYRTSLRNILGHNDYVILEDRVTSVDGTIVFSADEFIQSVYHLQELINTVLWCIISYSNQDAWSKLTDCGVVSIGFGINPDTNEPSLGVYQLWCFFNLDMEKNWIEVVNFQRRPDVLETRLGQRAGVTGPMDQNLMKWLQRVGNSIEVNVAPIMPYMGHLEARVDLGWGSYQICGDSFSKKVAVIIT